MSSLKRTIKRAAMFKGMNKQQRELWKAQHKRKSTSGIRHVNGGFLRPEKMQPGKEV